MTPPACSQLEITPFGDVTAKVDADGVATVEIHRPPENFFDVALIRSLADAYEAIEARGDCGAIVLCSEGKHFCAGADFSHRAASTRGGQPSAPRFPWSQLSMARRSVEDSDWRVRLTFACRVPRRVSQRISHVSAFITALGFP